MTQDAADWLTIWHSEAAALATDREVQEAWQRMVGMVMQQGAAWLQAAHEPPGRAGPHVPARTPSAGDALDAVVPSSRGGDGRNNDRREPDSRDDVIAALMERVAALERRGA